MNNKVLKFCTLFLLLVCTPILAFEKEDLIRKIELTKTLTFQFVQKIEEKTQTGSCFLKYPLLLNCSYNDNLQKNLISNGKTLAVIQRRYKKIFYYRLKKTALNFLSNKKLIIDHINYHDPILSDGKIKFEIIDKNNNKLVINFDEKNLNLKGWETEDAYGKKVSFEIFNIKTNTKIEKDLFKIPKPEDL